MNADDEKRSEPDRITGFAAPSHVAPAHDSRERVGDGRVSTERRRHGGLDDDGLLASTGLAIACVDPTLRLRRFTPATARLFDLDDDDLGRPLSDLAERLADPTLERHARAVLAGEMPRERVLHALGGRDWLRRALPRRAGSGELVGVTVTYLDVSARRAAERLAGERLTRLESIYRHSGVGHAELDAVLRYRHVNDALVAFTGLAADAHIGRTIPEVLASDAGYAAEALARRVLESGEPITRTTMRAATLGTADVVHDWSVSYHPIRHDDDSPVAGVDVIVRDITSRCESDRCNALERDLALRLAETTGEEIDAVLADALALLATSFAARAAALWRTGSDGRLERVSRIALPTPPSGEVALATALLDDIARAPLSSFAPLLGADAASLARPALPTIDWVADLGACHGFADAADAARVGTAFRVPFGDGETRLGLLAVLSGERLGDNPSARRMLERVGRALGAFVRRRENESRTRRRERELDTLTSALPDALLRFDRGARLHFANTAAAALSGIADPRELVGRTLRESALPQSVHDAMLKRLDEVFESGQPAGDEFALGTGRKRRWYRVRYVPERDEAGTLASVLAIVGDISDRRRVASALAERERRLERALDEVDTLYRNLPIGLCVVDSAYRLLRVNDELARIHGDPAARLVGRTLGELHPVFGEGARAMLDEVFTSGESMLGRELDGAFGTAGERRHWIVDFLPLRDAGGGTRAVSCTVQDITARKLTEQRLAARAAAAQVLGSARDLDAAVPALLAAVGTAFDADIREWWTLDPDTARLTCREFQTSSELGDAIATRRYFDECTFAPGEGFPGECWSTGHADRVLEATQDERLVRRREARELGLRTALAFPAMLDGRAIGVVTLFMRERLATDSKLLETLEQIGLDIGECERRLQGERALEQARAAAELANQSKGDFLANVSHELRSPLTAILGYADLLGARLSDPDDRHSVDTVRGNGQHLLALLNDILDLAKIESGKFAVETDQVGLLDVVGDVHALMAVRAAERGLAFDAVFEGLLPERIVTDELRLRQILINLIGNAIKFTDTGSVRVRVRLDGAASDAPRLAFDVVDTGIGMTRAQLERLFEPFTQVDNSNTRRYGGTGLGLAISRRLAELFGGTLGVRSRPGEGTTFTLTMPARIAAGAPLVPLALSGATVAALEDAPRAALPTLDAHVLVADDRPDIRMLIRRFLEQAGARVTAVVDGESVLETLDAAAHAGTPPDAVVMDMQMPRLDGYEATRRLRAKGFDRPVLALTAAAMKGERARCLAAGCDDYLSKPIDGTVLIETLASLVGQRRAHPEAPPSSGRQSARVLLVDDNDDARSVTARLLTRAGHEIRTAADGCDALAIAAEWRPDAVLLDLGLPDIDGHEVAARLRERHGEAITLVALSGRVPDAPSGRSSPFDHHLLKPAKLKALTGLLAAVGR